MDATMEVRVICTACDGTGLYQGMCEPNGVAVVCIRCTGTGCQKLRYEPFVKRKPRRGIKFVHRSKGTFIAGPVGPDKSSITYKEFCAGKMP